MAVVQISDVVVPQIFTPYAQQVTEEKAAIIQSGVAVRDSAIDSLLAGGGLTFNVPSWKDLDNTGENVSNDDPTQLANAQKTGTLTEVAVRLNRNQSWSSMDLASVLAGSDPANSIAQRVGYYWTRRMQAAFVATMKGVFANNAATIVTPAGNEVQNDLTNDISGGAYVAGVTDFNAASYIDAVTTMGDAMEDLSLVMVHSIVYSKILKNDLIDFIPDSEGKKTIATFQGRRIVMDDGMPFTKVGNSTTFETWFFGAGAVRLGVSAPKVPTEVKRLPEAGNGAGMETLFNRVQWCFHPVGHKYNGSAANGGPDNTASTNNLANATSWKRVFVERKQIKIARLITRET